ncbi:LytR C-terminal domain-containing protein, partial [Kitasatospora sp. NPDC059088]|uniref:LytR C-terminal domain-containing protein n=1 Tax=Kitasatospora sp. NPDC059088 TaxID=3346722 RepID=UPI003675C554
ATAHQPAAAPSRGAAPPPPAPPTSGGGGAHASNASVKVAVYNGTAVNGLAGKATDLLKGAKYSASTAGQAASTKYKTTTIEYGSSQKANAEKLAALFPGASLEPGSSRGISLIVGQDFAAANGMGAGASGAAATPGAQTPAQPLPTTVTNDARSADDDICANTTYGSGG